MEAPVQYKSGARLGNIPSLETMVDAQQPLDRAKLFADAGLTALADNTGPYQQLLATREGYTELTSQEYQLYADFMADHIQPENCTEAPPDGAIADLVMARQSNYFTDIVILQGQGEAMIVGLVENKLGKYYFEIGHWGETLTSAEELRQRQAPHEPTLTENVQQAFAEKLQAIRTTAATKRGLSDNAITLTTILGGTAAAWALLWLFSNWWIFAGVLAVAMIAAGIVAYDRSYHEIAGYLTGWLIAINVILATIFGFTTISYLNSVDNSAKVLTCSITYSKDSGRPTVHTTGGDFALDAGFYDGTFYGSNSDTVAKAMVGKWVNITYHGAAGIGPYITAGTTLEPGNCG